MNEPAFTPRHSWPKKFATAFRGIVFGTRGHNSFVIHVPAAIIVMIAAYALQVSRLEQCALWICITMVLTVELLNSALETLAKAVTRSENPFVGKALDIASGAVLVAAIGSAIVGAMIFIPRLL
jgi:diacylglycerol kinase